MDTWVALLRGVNVGGNNKVPMKPLAGALEALGHTRVRTYLQSGNVVLDTDEGDGPEVAAAVSSCIADTFGLTIGVVVRSPRELQRVVERNPFLAEAEDPTKVVVNFLAEAVQAKDLPAIPEDAVEEVRLDGLHLYVSYPDGQGRSKLDHRYWGKFPKVLSTARNWRTVLALHDLTRG